MAFIRERVHWVFYSIGREGDFSCAEEPTAAGAAEVTEGADTGGGPAAALPTPALRDTPSPLD